MPRAPRSHHPLGPLQTESAQTTRHHVHRVGRKRHNVTTTRRRRRGTCCRCRLTLLHVPVLPDLFALPHQGEWRERWRVPHSAPVRRLRPEATRGVSLTLEHLGEQRARVAVHAIKGTQVDELAHEGRPFRRHHTLAAPEGLHRRRHRRGTQVAVAAHVHGHAGRRDHQPRLHRLWQSLQERQKRPERRLGARHNLPGVAELLGRVQAAFRGVVEGPQVHDTGHPIGGIGGLAAQKKSLPHGVTVLAAGFAAPQGGTGHHGNLRGAAVLHRLAQSLPTPRGVAEHEPRLASEGETARPGEGASRPAHVVRVAREKVCVCRVVHRAPLPHFLLALRRRRRRRHRRRRRGCLVRRRTSERLEVLRSLRARRAALVLALAERRFGDFARPGHRDLLHGHELHHAGHLVLGDQRAAVPLDLRRRQLGRPGLEHDERLGDLAHRQVGDADDAGVADVHVVRHGVFHLHRIHVLRAHQHHVFLAVAQPQIPAVLHCGQVARSEPPAGGECLGRGVGALPIPREDGGATDPDLQGKVSSV